MKSIVFSLFFCALLAFAAADTERYKSPGTSDTIVLDLDGDCNYKYIAVEIENAKAGISAVEIKDSRAKSWTPMTYNSAKNEYEVNYQTRINFPISFQIISVNGETIIVSDAYRSLKGYDKVDTGKQFAADSDDSTDSTDETTDESAEETEETAEPDAESHQSSSNNNKGSNGKGSNNAKPSSSKATTTTTKAPKATTTKAPKTTAAPRTTKAPTTTKAPATTKASTVPTKVPAVVGSSSSSSSGCSADMKIMIPLYTYPGSTWDTVIASAQTVKTVAIINPNSGPGTGPDSAFTTYTKKMNAAGVEMVGYVHTSYGARDINTVKAEINVYAQEFQYVSGIFLDEASASANQLAYYQELHTYILSLPGFTYNIINPGTVPAAGYLAAATQIVSFESDASSFASSSNPSGASCSNKDQFVAIGYSASSTSSMQSFLTTAQSKGYYGWAYVTSGTLSGGTYNTLPSYYTQQATYMASL